MEFARRAAAIDSADGYGLPHPSPRAQMTIDALRQELWEESIRQEVIAAEIAEQRQLEAEVQRNLGLLCEVPSRFSSIQPFVLLHGGTLSLPHGELWLGEPMAMHAGASMSRWPVKDRIKEWYRPPWHRTPDEGNASFNGPGLRKKVSFGVKRKRSAETFQTNNKKKFVQRRCTVHHVNTCNELCFEEHSSGPRNKPDIAALESRKESIGMKKKVEAQSLSIGQNYLTWNCGICQANCTCELDLKNHLKGRRHQENIEVLKREDKEIEAKLDGKKAPQHAEKDQKLVPRWSCSTCKANCTSASDLENHFRGRRHRRNVDRRNSNIVPEMLLLTEDVVPPGTTADN